MQDDSTRLDRYALNASNAKAMIVAALRSGDCTVEQPNHATVPQNDSIDEIEANLRPSIDSVATMLEAHWKGYC